MSTVQFHRRYKIDQPVMHFAEQWNVHLFGPQGDPETYRVSFKLSKQRIPSFEVAIERPSGAFQLLRRQNQYKRIKRVMSHLQAEFSDYKYNKNYQVIIPSIH